MAVRSASRPVTKTGLDVPNSNSFRRVAKRVLGRDWQVGFLFVAPTVLLLFGLIGYPLLDALRLSFYNVTGVTNRGWVGLNNYERLWSDAHFRDSVMNTVKFAGFSVFIKFWIGLGTACLLNRANLRFSSVLTGLVLLPWIIPEVVAALTWRGLYDPIFGGLNVLLKQLGLIDTGIVWLGNPDLALPSVIAVNVWKGIPFFVIILLAGLKGIDAELYDAAAVDGATGWNRFRDITLPGLRYVIVVACLLSLIWTLNAFGLVYLLTGGGPGGATRVFSILSYEYALGQMRYSMGVSVAMAVVPALLVIIIILARFMRVDDAQPNEHPGLFARVLAALIWPIGKIGEGLVWLLGLVALPFAWVFERIGATAHNAYVHGEDSRERDYQKLQVRLGDTLAYVAIGLLLIVLLFPFYWVIITSFKTTAQIREMRSPFLPSPWSLEHYRFMLTQTSFPTWLWNTVQVAVVSTIISVVVASFGAYAMVRLKWRGAGFVQTAILFAYLMPTVLLFIPLYQIFTNLHLINTIYSLMIAYPTFGLPFACWLLMGYYRSIPKDLEDASLVDGANHFQSFIKIVLPLTLPALLAVALFSITSAWNEFLLAFVLVSPDHARTLPVGLGNMVTGDIFPFGQMSAASIMTAIPVAIIYMVAQKYMVAGLTAGSVKG